MWKWEKNRESGVSVWKNKIQQSINQSSDRCTRASLTAVSLQEANALSRSQLAVFVMRQLWSPVTLQERFLIGWRLIKGPLIANRAGAWKRTLHRSKRNDHLSLSHILTLRWHVGHISHRLRVFTLLESRTAHLGRLKCEHRLWGSKMITDHLFLLLEKQLQTPNRALIQWAWDKLILKLKVLPVWLTGAKNKRSGMNLLKLNRTNGGWRPRWKRLERGGERRREEPTVASSQMKPWVRQWDSCRPPADFLCHQGAQKKIWLLEVCC